MFKQQRDRRAEVVKSELKPGTSESYLKGWAVIVGISQYQYARWNLNYAHRDADEFYKLLLQLKGIKFEKERIQKLTDKKATTKKIREAISSFLQEPKEDDLVLIYFACHGSPDPKRPKNLYILTHDTQPSNIASTALAMQEINNSIERNLNAKKVIILADTCHSGGIASDGQRSPEDNRKSQLMNEFLEKLRDAKPGIVTFASAQSGEVALEDKKWGRGHGVFTYYLLEGMRGKADKDNSGIVTISELFDYVCENVNQDTEKQQNPLYKGDFDLNLPIAIIPTSKQYFEEALEFYKDDKLNEAISKLKQAVQLDPKNGLYQFALGDLLYNQGKINEAIKAYEKGFSLGAKNANVYSHLGFIFYSRNQFNEAIDVCKEAISVDSECLEAYITLGAVYRQQGKLEEAASNYKLAIDIDANSFEANLGLGMVRFKQKKLDEALKAFEKAKQIDPNQPVVWLQLGIVLYEKSYKKSAVEHLEKAISLYRKDNQNKEADKIQSFVNQIQAQEN